MSRLHVCSVAQSVNVDFNATGGSAGPYFLTATAPDMETTWNDFAVEPTARGSLIAITASGSLVTSKGESTRILVSMGNFKVYQVDENAQGKRSAKAQKRMRNRSRRPRNG